MINLEFEKLRRLFHEYGNGFEKIKGYWQGMRKLPVVGEITEEYVQQLIVMLVQLDFESNDRITLLLSSGGGSVNHGYQLADAIQALNSPVDVVAIGDNSSLAIDIIQMCEKRKLLPGTRLLLHYVRSTKEWIGDDVKRLEKDLELFKQSMLDLRERRFSLYEKKTKMKRKKLREIFRFGEVHHDFIDAQQALKLGLADEIITDFKFFPGKTYKK